MFFFCDLTEVLDLSQDVYQIKTLTGDHGEHLNRVGTEVELLGQGCDLCGTMEAELQKVKNHSQHALGQMQTSIHAIQRRLESGGEGCSHICSQLQDQVLLLRHDVSDCTSQCGNTSAPKAPVSQLGEWELSTAPKAAAAPPPEAAPAAPKAPPPTRKAPPPPKAPPPAPNAPPPAPNAPAAPP